MKMVTFFFLVSIFIGILCNQQDFRWWILCIFSKKNTHAPESGAFFGQLYLYALAVSSGMKAETIDQSCELAKTMDSIRPL